MLIEALLTLLYYVIFFICFQFSLKYKRILNAFDKFIGVRNYIFLFWVLIPVGLSWLFSRNLTWLNPPNVQDMILIPFVLLLVLLVSFFEYWYRIHFLKDKAILQSLKIYEFNIRKGLQELGEQIYSIGLPEEFISRGFLLTFLIPATGKIVAAMFSGVSFGVFHLAARDHHDMLKGITTTVSGLFLAFSFVYSESVWIPAAVHILSNLSLAPMLKTIALKIELSERS